MVGVNSTSLAEKVLRGVGAELIERQVVRTFDDLNTVQRCCNCSGLPPAAERAIASANGIQTISQANSQLDRSTMAGGFQGFAHYFFLLITGIRKPDF